MIEALYEIGKIQLEESFLDEYIDGIGGKYKHVFRIVFDITNLDKPQYQGIEYAEFDSRKKLEYLYKRGSSNGADYTPISKIVTLKKTYERKILRSVAKFIENNKKYINEQDRIFLDKINSDLQDKAETIFADLQLMVTEEMELSNPKDEIKDGGLLTLSFRDRDNIKYLGELELFPSTFEKQQQVAYTDYFYSKTYKKESKAEDKFCYVCKRKEAEVWGYVKTYNFYTIDKSSFISGGFQPNKSWHNYPVCPKCAITLKRGRKYVDKHLRFRFCGLNYILIPQILTEDKQLLSNILGRIENYKINYNADSALSNSNKRNEMRILAMLAEEKNYLNYHFFFYEEAQSGMVFKILLNLQEIAPSRLSELVNAKKLVDNHDKLKINIFQEFKTKKGEIDFEFSFYFIRSFFSNSKINGNYDKDFLLIINNIFIDEHISLHSLLKRFLELIRPDFLNENFYFDKVIKSYKILKYVDELNLLKKRDVKMEKVNDFMASFFAENPLLDSVEKKALFLEGVLIGKLLAIQYVDRKSKPFLKRLNGLKIDDKIAHRVFTEAVNKLEEYDKNYYKELEQVIAEYLLKSELKKYSVDELSYFFTLGMTLTDKILPSKLNSGE